MEELADIKKIWIQADVEKLSPSEKIVELVAKIHFISIAKKITIILIALALAVIVVYVIFYYKSQFLTTRIGEASFLIAICILIFSNVRAVLSVADFRQYSNHDFVQNMKAEQLKDIRLCKTTQSIGFAISSFGLLAYLYELVYLQPALTIYVYGAAIAFLLFNWFIIRPMSIKRKIKHLRTTIQKVELLENQFTEK
jgi:hypothetical protein